MKWFAPPLIALALLIGACQSEKAGMQVLCNAPNDCADCMKAEPAMKMMLIAKHVEENLSNSEVVELFAALAAAGPEAKHRMLSQRAKALGLSSCPLAELIKADMP